MLAKNELEWSYEDGEVIVAEGDQASEMFVIQQGAVRVTKRVGTTDVVLATLERGNFFGEMSLLESLPRHATCRAVGPTRVLAIRSGDLLMKIRRDPTFAFEMLQRMSQRIRFLNEQIVAMLEEGALSRDRLAGLVLQAEYEPRRERNIT